MKSSLGFFAAGIAAGLLVSAFAPRGGSIADLSGYRESAFRIAIAFVDGRVP